MKKWIFIILSIILFISAIISAKPVETELSDAFLDSSSHLSKLAKIASKNLNIIIESENADAVESIKSELNSPQNNFQDIADVYRDYPANFLSETTEKFLKEGNYKQIEKNALERLYNPLGIYIAPLDKDPYLFATDFVMSNSKLMQNEDREFEGKYYSVIHKEIETNKDVQKMLDIQKSVQDAKIYLAGTPIHSYITSTKSNIEINIICVISTLALILLCKFYFKSAKILIHIALSILFGFMTGYAVSALIFPKLHVITFVFSTSLIGISLDYSLHYYLTAKEKGFVKSLTASMLTTVFAFLILLFSDIEVLRQIAVFTSAGLIGVYLYVLIMLQRKELEKEGRLPKLKIDKLKPYIFVFVFAVILLGGSRMKFNDNIKNFYTPPKNLLESETIYKKVFNPKTPEFIIVSGNSADDILQKEEKLKLENTIGLSNFISSKAKQSKNLKLVKKLYENNLNTYGTFLSTDKRKELIKQTGRIYDPADFPLNSKFMLDDKTSYIITYNHQENSINPADEISKHLEHLRKECIKFSPLMFVILYLFLSFAYGIKKSAQIIISPLLGAVFSICLISLFGIKINMFHLLGLFLIIGFTLDYSIFRANGCEKSKDAVFLSCASTAFSFFLLSFTSFQLISSLGMTVFLGITASYILSLFMIKSKNEQ